jgi:hypothetical protein
MWQEMQWTTILLPSLGFARILDKWANSYIVCFTPFYFAFRYVEHFCLLLNNTRL